MRALISLIIGLIVVMFSLSMGGVLAADEDPAEPPVEDPEDPADPVEELDETGDGDSEFEDGDTGIIDGCEGEIYSTPEAARAAADAQGTDFHEHYKEDGTVYYMLNPTEPIA
mgnify:CR=1 FL=1|tara:strand:+ start:555 stop:893 length:339 start_codon:yes stop_codon:yes gene_type:complete